MRILASLLAVVLLSPLTEIPTQAETRVQVEAILLTYTYQQRPQPAMHEQLAEYCKTVEESEESLVALIDRWLEGKDRTQFTVDALLVTTAMGQEVEVVSQQSLPMQTAPLVLRVPQEDNVPPMSLGVQATLRATEGKGKQIDLDLRFGKRTLLELPPREEERNQNGQVVPGIASTWMSMQPTLRPGVPHVQGGLIQKKKTSQGDVSCDAIFVTRARRVPAFMNE